MDAFNRMMCGTSRKKSSRKRGGLCGIKGGKNNFTKRDIVKYVAEKSKLTQATCTQVINHMVDFFNFYGSYDGSCITIAGFGSFRSKEIEYNTKLNGRRYKGKCIRMYFKQSKK